MIKRINMDISWIFRCLMVGRSVTRFFNFSILDFSLDFILNNISFKILQNLVTYSTKESW